MRSDLQGIPRTADPTRMSDCLFCKIIAGQIPAAMVHQDDTLVAFKDINPQAPLHLLIVPKKHIASLNELSAEDDALIGVMMRRAASLAKVHGTAMSGDTGPCSIRTARQVKRCFTFTCTCWRDAAELAAGLMALSA